MKNLIFSSVGSDSNYHSWLKKPAESNFDIILVSYDDTPIPAHPLIKKSYFHEGTKFQNFYWFYTNNKSLVQSYTAVFIMDDDLVMETKQISRFFTIFDQNQFSLAQPAFSRGSHISHLCTRRKLQFKWRYFNFVEAGATCFSIDALNHVVQYFPESPTGFGLDFLFGEKLDQKNNIAIVDITPCMHPRRPEGLTPLDKFLPRRRHKDSWYRLARKYGLSGKIQYYGNCKRHFYTYYFLLVNFIELLKKIKHFCRKLRYFFSRGFNTLGVCFGLLSFQRLDRKCPNINHRLLKLWNKRTAVELQKYLQFNLEISFDPGGFLACFKRKFLAVYVPKNGTTTLTDCVCSEDYPSAYVRSSHDFIGYAPDVGNRISKKATLDESFDSFIRFAVYRDPVDRLCSLYNDKVRKGHKGSHRIYFWYCGIAPAEVDEFIDFAERELTKPMLSQDEHIRKQSSFYCPDEVDYIVNIKDLNAFFTEKLGLSVAKQLNKTTSLESGISQKQIERIKDIYKEDYALLSDSKKIYIPARAKSVNFN